MDKLRRSFRSSIRRKKNKDRDQQQETGGGGSGDQNSTGGGGTYPKAKDSGTKAQIWQQDEIAVRSGTCSFNVKYLGCVEVFESRGMQVCEEAIKVLKASKRKSVRALLYVHGDGLRVVDEETKGLIVDQTIEKVSFCAPDRNFERGFSYICRDGTTRRWMCHGFMAIKESGERLSHAVGCAFAICLEKKQQRDKLCTVSMSFDTSNASFTRHGSFRQATITERLQDPQAVKPSIPRPPSSLTNGAAGGNVSLSGDDSNASSAEANPFAIARPHASDLMKARQTSFRGLGQLNANSPFKRNLSLRLGELPSTLERQQSDSSIRSPSQLQPASFLPATIPENEEFYDDDEINTSLEKEEEEERRKNEQSQSQNMSNNFGGLNSSLIGGGISNPLQPQLSSGSSNGAVTPVNVLKSQLSALYQQAEQQRLHQQQLMQQQQGGNANPFLDSKFESPFASIAEDAEESSEAADPIGSMCKELSRELTSISKSKQEPEEKEEQQQSKKSNEDFSHDLEHEKRLEAEVSAVTNNREFNSLPYIPATSAAKPVLSSSTTNNGGASTTSASSPQNQTQQQKKQLEEALVNVKPVQYDNPWDFVPDQPSKEKKKAPSGSTFLNPPPFSSTVTAISSSSNSSGGSNSDQFVVLNDNSHITTSTSSNNSEWFNNNKNANGFADDWSSSNNKANNGLAAGAISKDGGILDDPFDAEWAALAARNAAGGNVEDDDTNPFRAFEDNEMAADNNVKAFELQL